MKTLLITAFLFSSFISSCQVQWKSTMNWRLYRYQGNGLFNISLDSLSSFQNIPLNQDSMNIYLSNVEIKHPKAATHWMGGYIATCELGDGLRKVDLSNYGGFFYDEKAKAYYQVASEKIDGWLTFLQNSYMTLVKGSAK